MKRTLYFLLAIALFPPGAFSISEDELLEPEQAFRIEATAIDADTIRLEWDIADGYYLYQSKIRIASKTPGIELGEPGLPPGKPKHDEFFGDIEIYRGKVAAQAAVTRELGAPRILQLEAGSQGCADIGVCYPPQIHRVTLELPAQTSSRVAPETSASLRAIASLGKSLGLVDDGDDVLPPDQAFQPSAEALDGHTVLARWQIAEGHYLYKDKFKLALLDRDGQPVEGVTIDDIVLPPGKLKDDEFFGRIEVYDHDMEARIALLRDDNSTQEMTLQAAYQGCAEQGICYPPIVEYVTFTLPETSAAADQVVAASSSGSRPSGDTAPAVLSEQDRLAQSLSQGQTWLTILSFFGFGLLLAFTPCVFPMIPILSSIIVGHGDRLTTGKAFRLSLTYVLAMAATYTLAGVIAAVFGANLQAAFQDPWIIGSFSALFVLLALSMFGFYELQIPAFLQSKLSVMSNRRSGGTYGGVAVMGLLSALIVGPCVAPPLAGALIYIGQTGDAILGGTALFALSLGMGAPLLAIGTSAGKLLPKAGGWMDLIKAVFGVLLLGVAVWLLERILPGEITLVLWALLLIVPAIYMGALEPIQIEATGWKKLWKGLGLGMLIYGAVLIIGAASGSRDAFQPLRLLASGDGAGTATAHEQALPFKPVKSIIDVEREVAAASGQGRSAMLDFYADWCVSCKEMERYTFSNPNVQQILANTTLLQADVTANDATDQALLKHFGLIGPPSILFYGDNGQELRPFRLVGFLDADAFRRHAAQAIR